MNESGPKADVGAALESLLDTVRRKILAGASVTSGGGEHIINLSLFLQGLLLGDRNFHVQTWVPSASAMVDSRICVTVDLLNKVGVRTTFSCEDLPDGGTGNVQFVVSEESADRMRSFLSNIVHGETRMGPGPVEFVLGWQEHLRLLHRLLSEYLEASDAGRSQCQD